MGCAQDLKKFTFQDWDSPSHVHVNKGHARRMQSQSKVGSDVTGVSWCVDVFSSVATMLVMTSFAQSNAVLWVSQVFWMLTQTTPVVNIRGNAFAPNTISDSLADDVVCKQPLTELQPACSLVEAAKFVIQAFLVHTLVVLHKMFRTVATGIRLNQWWASDSATGLPRLKGHGLIRRDL